MTADRKRQAAQDEAVEESFPASDPPGTLPESGARAVPPQSLMDHPHPPAHDAVMLRRRFPDGEKAKLALEWLVREGPIDRSTAKLVEIGREIELRVCAPPEDAHRIRGLLAHA